MRKIFALWLALFTISAMDPLEARIKLVEVENQSEIVLKETFSDGTPYRELLDKKESLFIGAKGATIASSDGSFSITFEEAFHSGFHRPHWKFHVWLNKKDGWPMLPGKRLLYAVIFYDGDGEVSLSIDKKGIVRLQGGYDVKDILYPWAVGTIGRGNPYLQIKNSKQPDENGVRYFDRDGFASFNGGFFFWDDGCGHP